jgi:hypothetical protein
VKGHPSGRWIELLLMGTIVTMLLAGDCDREAPTDYEQLTGTVVVAVSTTGGLPDPDGYTVEVDGVTQTVPANGSVTFSDVEAFVQLVEVDGLAANCECTSAPGRIHTIMVPGGSSTTLTVTVECPILASLAVTIDGLPPGVDGRVTVQGGGGRRPVSQTLTQSSTIPDLWPAEYTVFGLAVSSGGVDFNADPISQDIVLGEGEIGNATVTYSGGLGALDIVVGGLPAGVDADVTVTGPGGFSTTLTSSVTLADLSPGDYTIVAEPVSSAEVTYGPEPLSQTVAVGGTETTMATVTYAVISRPPVVFQDDFSVGDLWEETVISATTGATSTFETRPTGGVSGGYRHMTHVFAAPGNIAVQHLYTGGSYDPSVDGAIEHINYSEWRIQLDPPFPTARIGSLALVVQSGVVYTARINDETSYASQTWEKGEAVQLTAADFGPAGLDLSDQGAEIFFGFYRANSTGGVLTTTHGIDDWRVEIIRVQN